MSKGITLSKEFGLNPSITHCEVCGKEIGIALFGASYKDPKTKKTVEAPKDVFMGLCDNCKKVVDAEGLIIIEVKDGEKGPNPYRTGRVIGITKEAKERIFPDTKESIVYMEETPFTKTFGHLSYTEDKKE